MSDKENNYHALIYKVKCRRIKIALLGLTAVLICFGMFTLIFPSTISQQTFNQIKKDKELLKMIEISDGASKLPKSGKLFCWVQTSSKYHDSRALAINETWIHRCDHGELFTNQKINDSRIPHSTIFAGIPDDYNNLFFKTRFAFHYIYEQFSPHFEWYLKADDDTYVIVENLNTFLSNYNPDEPHYFGYVLKPYFKDGYNSGGGGYVLSREALKIFNEQLYHNKTSCPDDIYEDLGIARCLYNAKIIPGDTRNEKGQNRFNGYSPMTVFHQKGVGVGWGKYPEKARYDGFANDLISFHHLSPDEIRLFDILLYRTTVKSL